MEAVAFLVNTLFGLATFVLLLRLLLQGVRADFRNPLVRGIAQLTNPVILPLRRWIPAVGRIDSASVLAVVAMTACKLWVLELISPLPAFFGLNFVRLLAIELVQLLLQSYLYLILLYAVSSFFTQGGYSPGRAMLASLCEPILQPIRRRLPAISGFDLSPLVALLAIQALLLLVR
ncbi:MAG: hypothetical protein RLZZ200_160 [Pseudomonadota bacterium]|jgi:YggT family protein